MHTVRDKNEYHRQTSERMDRDFTTPDWSMRQKLALACRMLAMDGHDSRLAGQLSARAEKSARITRCASGWLWRRRPRTTCCSLTTT